MRNYKQNNRMFNTYFSSFFEDEDDLNALYDDYFKGTDGYIDGYDDDDEDAKYEAVMDVLWNVKWGGVERSLRNHIQGVRCVIKEASGGSIFGEDYYVAENGYDCLTNAPMDECEELEVVNDGNCLYIHGHSNLNGYDIERWVRKLTQYGNALYDDWESNGYYSSTKRDPKIYELDEDEIAEKLYNSTHYSTNPMKN